MNDPYLDNFKSPKYHVKKYLEHIKTDICGKIVLDVPAGNGVTTQLLCQYGARVEPFDLFPEYFMFSQPECKRADIMEGIPVEDHHADWLICQEGIEHFSDPLQAYKEFNRVLKTGGELLLTTPSYSNLSAKLSYLLFESETNKRMPPNEIDDIWMSDKSISTEIYHGHIFLLGLQKLRILAKLSGFQVKEIRYVRLSKGSLLLFPFFYPLIFISSYWRYYRNLRKNRGIPHVYKKAVYQEQLQINLRPANLINHHIFMVFKKEKDVQAVDFRQESMLKPFEKMM